MTNGQLETITPSKTTTVDNLINAAMNNAIKEDLKHQPESLHDYAVVRAGAIERMSAFGDQLHSATLKVMRDMEQEMSYNHLGFESLVDWVHSLALPDSQTDTLLRLARAVERIFVLTDSRDWVYEDAQGNEVIITSDLLIEKSSPSALMKMSFSFINATDEQQEVIARELLTGTSNAKQIKRTAGVVDDVTLEATVELDGDNKIYRFVLTPVCEAFLQERLKGSLVVRFTPEE
jgi:hypothetical protein